MSALPRSGEAVSHGFVTLLRPLPEPLEALYELAFNLRWCWDEPSRNLFRILYPEGWQRSGHNPLALLAGVPAERLDEMAADEAFLASLAQAQADLASYMTGPRWFQNQGSPLRSVAYFSPEFGVCEPLPQYSGGLGVLAGDHLKAASDLGLPLVAVGLMYRRGFFRQSLDETGWQKETYSDFDPAVTPARVVEGVEAEVELAGERVAARVWRADVGRTRLYLLDSDLEKNSPEGRKVTNQLYAGDREHRIRQEILLGIGGLRALDALGETTQIFHINEGHAGFLALERIRQLVEGGASLEESVEAIRSSSGFTTHTSVPAGIDIFSRDLMEKYFGKFARSCGMDMDGLMELGHEPATGEGGPFNMAVMSLRLAGRSVGVSKLHGKVSRSIFHSLWTDRPERAPIGSVTNGVHARSWVTSAMKCIFEQSVGDKWDEAGPAEWRGIFSVDDKQLWEAKCAARRSLVDWVREQGTHWDTADLGKPVFNPDALTIGFARRFAGYKRPTLLLSQEERLRSILSNSERPVQFLLAGKAHPADEAGKKMIQEVVVFSRDPDVGRSIAFVSDYDIGIARRLFQGVDVWLNNPLRPLEACGTSGEKAAFNGVLNLSIPDGWWDEMYDGQNGWAIPSAEEAEDPDVRNEKEAKAMFDVLEHDVIPLFYDRGPEGLPTAWIAKVKTALASLAPRVSAYRMLKDYMDEMYEPLAASASKRPEPPD